MSLASVLKSAKAPKQRTEPLWQGPEADGPNGGVTYSLLSRFLCCRERFRLKVIEGLEPTRTWNHKTGYGDMWHVCEEVHALGSSDQWLTSLQIYASTQCKLYPTQQEQIEHWYNVCKVQFPLYVDYWSKHKDITSRTPLLQEQVFSVPYKLPSGRRVRLRGKWDSVDLVKNGKGAGVWLMENKTKGDIKEGQMVRQLTFDLQTMLYIVALTINLQNGSRGLPLHDEFLASDVKGVRYNVVRRPLSGGKGSIVRHKPSKSNPLGESKEAFYDRVAQYIKDEPETYFMRWNVDITPGDIEKFRRQCLDPILEQLCDWYEYINLQSRMGDPFFKGGSDYGEGSQLGNNLHWRHPFGVYNVLDEGGSSDLDEYLASGSEVGLTRVNSLFTELS